MDSKEATALKILERHIRLIREHNFKVSEPNKNNYSYQVAVEDKNHKIFLQVYFGKKGNRILLQGNKDLPLYKNVDELIFGERLLNNVKPEIEPDYPYIGTDESGKGDFFGPLVISAVYVEPEIVDSLQAIGVKDSKELSDFQISIIAKDIINSDKVKQETVFISPEKYNQLYKSFGNLNRLMAWGHSRVIENLLINTGATEVISDKFGNESLILNALMEKGKKVKLNQVTKAEKFIAVAAASILARESVVKWFRTQSKKYKLEIPKGASIDVERFAIMFRSKYGEEELKKLVKLHFKTSTKVFNN